MNRWKLVHSTKDSLIFLTAVQCALSLCQVPADSFQCGGHHSWYPLSSLEANTHSAHSIQIKVICTWTYPPPREICRTDAPATQRHKIYDCEAGTKIVQEGMYEVQNDKGQHPSPFGLSQVYPGVVAGTFWVGIMIDLAGDSMAELGMDLQGILGSSSRARTWETPVSIIFFFSSGNWSIQPSRKVNCSFTFHSWSCPQSPLITEEDKIQRGTQTPTKWIHFALRHKMRARHSCLALSIALAPSFFMDLVSRALHFPSLLPLKKSDVFYKPVPWLLPQWGAALGLLKKIVTTESTKTSLDI